MKHSQFSLFRRFLAFVWIITIILSVFPASAEPASLEESVTGCFRRRQTSGGMLLIAKDGEIVFEFCYGFADKNAKEYVSPDTYFKIASVSKLVTAVSVMKLVETGRLNLDENIGHYLGAPSFEAANPYYPKISLTARILMTHTSGIIDGKGAFSLHKPLHETLNPKKNKAKSGFNQQKPGTKYAYSNFGAGILGSVLEVATGKRLTDAARELLFDSMEIDAAYDAHLVGDPSKIVTTYKADGSIMKTRSYRLNKETYDPEIDPDTDYDESYGDLWIRGRDLCRIGIMLCDLGVIDGQRFLEENTVLEMISSQKDKGGVKVDSPYGLNVERVKSLIDGKLIYGHQGMSEGVLCNLYFDPETRFVFALLTNGCDTTARQNRICTLTRQLFALAWSAYVEE